MKKIAALLFFVSLASWAEEESNTSKINYSYFTVGSEQINYKENASLVAANSSVNVSNIMINSGGLYDINDKYAFSIDALATFYPGTETEDWSQGNAGVYQQNDFEYKHASTNILLHYKLTPSIRFIAGGGFSLITYKRSGVKLPLSDGSVFKSGVIEEKSNELYLDAGMAYESGNLNKQWRYGAKATIGVPIWTETTNTLYQDLTFEHSGYRASIEGNVSYRIVKGLHFGVYARAAYMQRNNSGSVEWTGTLIDQTNTYQVEVPEAETKIFSVGAMFLWDL